jgi:hypothetical protein
MRCVRSFGWRAIPLVVGLFAGVVLVSASEQSKSGQLLIHAVSGSVTFAADDGVFRSLEPKMVLGRGVEIKTGENSTADIVLQYSGTVLRMTPNTVLDVDKLKKAKAGEDIITETSLRLTSGSIVGSQRKLSRPSRFDVVIPGGVATIVGTEYLVRSDGAVTVISGQVTINYNLPGNKGSVKVTIPAGYSFDPATGQVVPTTPEYLTDIIADVDTVRENAQTYKVANKATLVVKPEQVLSPVLGTTPSEPPPANMGPVQARPPGL